GAPGGGVRCSTGVKGAATLVIVAGPPEVVRTALRASAHAAAHERHAVAPVAHGGVPLASGVAEVDEGFAWPSTRLARGVRRDAAAGGRPGGSTGLVWCGLAAAALGDDEAAALCVRALADGDETSAAALVAGRLALATGRVGEALTRAAAAVGTPAGTSGSAGPHGDATRAPTGAMPLTRAAATVLADGLRYALPDASLERLRA